MGGIATDRKPPPRCPASTPAASAPASASTAPIGSARTPWPSCWCSAARPARKPPRFAREAGDADAAALRAAGREIERTAPSRLLSRGRQRRAAGHAARRMTEAMQDGVGIFRSAAGHAATCETLAELARSPGTIRLDDRSRASTPNGCRRSSSASSSTWPRRWRGRRWSARNRAAPISGSTSSRARRREASSSTRWPSTRPGGPPRIEYQPVNITRLPPAERVYGGRGQAKAAASEARSRRMTDIDRRDRDRGAALSPRARQEPRISTLHRALHARHLLLQGLQYIKDHLDGSLTFRWSCRMAICGSCGKMVERRAGALLPDLPARLLPGQGPGRAAARISRSSAIWPSTRPTFSRSCGRIKPYIMREEEKPLSDGRLQADAGAAGQVSKQFSDCINCMLCYAACPQYGLNSEFQGPAILPCCTATTATAATRARPSACRSSMPRTASGAAPLVGACSAVCPKGVDPAAAVNRNKLNSTMDYFLRFVTPRGTE
jgi:fumarate reductase iron-sulfur subunit